MSIFKGTGQRRAQDEGSGGLDEVGGAPLPVAPTSVRLLATLALVITTLATVLALAYEAIIDHDAGSATSLMTLGTIGIGALVVLAGGQKHD